MTISSLIQFLLSTVITELTAVAILADSDKELAQVHIDRLHDLAGQIPTDPAEDMIADGGEISELLGSGVDKVQQQAFANVIRKLDDKGNTATLDDFTKRDAILMAVDEYADAVMFCKPSIWTEAIDAYLQAIGWKEVKL